MLAYFLYGLFFVSCLVLIVTVLLQPGKADAGALFTSSVSSTAFGPRGTQSVLSRITIGAALIFMLSALLLSFQAITGSVSVMQGSGNQSIIETSPAVPVGNVSSANTDVTGNSAAVPTNTAANAETNTNSR